MNYTKQFFTGLQAYPKALKMMRNKSLWIYIFLPFLIFLLIVSAENYFDHAAYDVDIETAKWYHFWTWIKFGFFKSMFWAIVAFEKFILFALLSPVLAMLSEKVEEIITGNVYPFNLNQLLKDIKRGLKISLRNFIYYYLIAFGISIVLWFFGLGALLSGVVFTLVGAYYYGFGFIDYINERRRLSVEESVTFVKKYRIFSVTIGLIFALIIDIPEYLFENNWIDNLGVIIAPVWAMIATTIAMHEIIDLNTISYSQKKR